MTAPRILISGATGFIGSHVVAAARHVPGVRLRLMPHRTALTEAPGTGAGIGAARARLAEVPYALHHLDMLAVDHWFADERVWQDADCEPGAGFATTFARHASRHRQFLGR
ncbi:hypothetical protein [Streptomyces sp. NBC_00316]|uniref:hypothetical protein n=1 Tax=Streptomyces sp. NBC_00316 TaxID=2975710 RepID=UPI002E297821|nr:hypothetical protein [Streptomyces sp. NBC_00316]